MADTVHELLVTDVAAEKLGRRGISDEEAEQLIGNANVTVRNSGVADKPLRRLLIGRTDGGRTLTLVIEQTIDPTTWVVVSGWTASSEERRMLGS